MIGTLVGEKLGPLSIWHHVVQGAQYVIGIDVAEGKIRDQSSARKRDQVAAASSDRPDYSCAIVLEMETGNHVASWHGWMYPGDFAIICLALGYHFNTALLAPERNSYGIALVEAFVNNDYPNLYRQHSIVGRIGANPLESNIGWTTSAVSKPLLIERIREMISSNPTFTLDKDLIGELRTMEIEPGKGEARARGRNKDDRVIALGIALQARIQYLTGSGSLQLDPLDSLDYMDRKVWRHWQERRDRANRTTTDLSDPRGFGLGRRPRVGAQDAVQDFRDTADAMRREFERFGGGRWGEQPNL